MSLSQPGLDALPGVGRAEACRRRAGGRPAERRADAAERIAGRAVVVALVRIGVRGSDRHVSCIPHARRAELLQSARLRLARAPNVGGRPGHDGGVADASRPRRPTPCCGRPSRPTAPSRPLLVLLHGYGADERDLFGARRRTCRPSSSSPRSARPLAPPWPAPGYSWYPIEGLESRDPAHVTDAASRAHRVARRAPPPTRAVGLLGFSQGAAVALQAMRLEPERFAFVVNLSGYATPGELPGDAALAERRPPVFWGRGTHDDVIPRVPRRAHDRSGCPSTSS